MSSPFAMTGEGSPASYPDVADGVITLKFSGGRAPYSVSWEDGATDRSIVRPPGVYNVTATDADGTELTDSFVIASPPTFDVDRTPYECAYLCDTVVRDLQCRYSLSEGTRTVGRGAAAHAMFVRGSESSRHVATVRGLDNPTQDAGGRMILSVADAGTAAVPAKDVVFIDADGIRVEGDLTVTGATTEVLVADIKVQDKTITLSAGETGVNEIDGSGVLFGEGGNGRRLLYGAVDDALVSDASLYLSSPGADLRIGGSYAGATTVLSEGEFKVQRGSASIALDGAGLRLTRPELIDPVYSTAHVVSDYGLLFRSNGNYLGFDGTRWSTSGAGIRSAYLSTIGGGVTVSSTGFSMPVPNTSDTVALGASGLSLGGTVAVNSGGLDLKGDDACIYLGNKNWKISYDDEENAIVFQKLVDGEYVTKLNLD